MMSVKTLIYHAKDFGTVTVEQRQPDLPDISVQAIPLKNILSINYP
jgi:hypothetical protein